MASGGQQFERKRQRKRPKNTQQEQEEQKTSLIENADKMSPVVSCFVKFQQELDCKYDKYERLVKLSRDVTIHSKRIIFVLQRVAGIDDREKIFTEVKEKFDAVKLLLKSIALELQGDDPYLFLRAYSPGLQEYVEAVTFFNYLKNSSLISFEELSSDLTFKDEENSVNLEINPFDYILGVADLTGELMRLCINSAANGDCETPFKVCNFLRNIHEAFLSFGNINRDLSSKIRVLRSSLGKVESACYTLQVRGSEIPKHVLADVLGKSADIKGIDIDEL